MPRSTVDKLKPCPFCGGEAELCKIDGFAIVRCKVCDADCGPREGEPSDAAKYWNTRVKS